MMEYIINRKFEVDHFHKLNHTIGTVLAPLNLASWSHFIQCDHSKDPKSWLNPFDSMLLQQRIEELEEDLEADFMCETLTLLINLNDMSLKCTYIDDNDLKLERSKQNIRMKSNKL